MLQFYFIPIIPELDLKTIFYHTIDKGILLWYTYSARGKEARKTKRGIK